VIKNKIVSRKQLQWSWKYCLTWIPQTACRLFFYFPFGLKMKWHCLMFTVMVI